MAKISAAKARAQACPVEGALRIIGDRWTLLVLRDLFLQGPRKFMDLKASLAGIAPSTLSRRLQDLQKHGLIQSRLYAEHPPRPEYFLTDKGRDLRPILLALQDWGKRHLG
jgi:DNA-binding HxlR family transcriptional regulator